MSDFAYVAYKPCGCAAVFIIDDVEHRQDVADTVAECIRDGLSVQRIPRVETLALLQMPRCQHGLALQVQV